LIWVTLVPFFWRAVSLGSRFKQESLQLKREKEIWENAFADTHSA
jgi:hypothetical protein